MLFEVGIEIDVRRLRDEYAAILLAVPIQVGVTMAVSVGALTLVGLPLDAASIIALGVASSSSVVVVNITRSRRRTTNP